MNITELIKKRRSVFPAQYNSKEITNSTIEEILEVANWAPTHRKTEPWRFKVIQGEAKKKLGDFMVAEKQKEGELSSFKERKIRSKCEASSAILAICMQRDPKESVPEWEEVAAVSMAVQNMWLKCTELGVGSYWSSPAVIGQMHKFFKFEENEKCLGFFYMGYYEGELAVGERKSTIEDKTEWLQ
ncbi:MAG: nitroreductase [Flavobacteriaceae bacterium]|nr:nitroreductase [Flavobacteriaceae bacterium]